MNKKTNNAVKETALFVFWHNIENEWQGNKRIIGIIGLNWY
jgi:hypothetical protein